MTNVLSSFFSVPIHLSRALAYFLCLTFITTFFSCSDSLFDSSGKGHDRITLSGEIGQVAVTRVNDNGFADGDVMGVYIVDYHGNVPGQLQSSGNHADNVRHTFVEAENRWQSDIDMFWTDKHTHISVYSYYPYAQPDDVSSMPFVVEADQSQPTADGVMGGYEKSDFLWGHVDDVAPTESAITVPMSHRMGCARVTLVEGSGFASGEWAGTSRSVLAMNLRRESAVSLVDGSVTVKGEVSPSATIPARHDDEWRAIVVPQTVEPGTTLFAITVGGQPYRFTKKETITYATGKMTNFTIRVDKKPSEGRYALTLVGQTVTPWENDLVSHDAQTREYVIVHSVKGKLRSALAAAHKDYTRVKNLKVTGSLDAEDFAFMRDEMSVLEAINLKETTVYGDYTVSHDDNEEYHFNEKGVIPNKAFDNKKSLRHVVLPDRLRVIGYDAFYGCSSLTGSLYIPEGVEYVCDEAFAGCSSLKSDLSLPSTLKVIGKYAFSNCDFSCELVLPSSLRYIEPCAFYNNTGLYGQLHLPSSLEFIGHDAFSYCEGLRGDLVIPQKVSVIPDNCFTSCGFDGTLTLHDGVTSVGASAFQSTDLKGELHLPDRLEFIGAGAFSSCKFSGSLTIPRGIEVISGAAFNNTSFSGTVTLPSSVQTVGSNAFSSCHDISRLVIPQSVENIRERAFYDCTSLSSVVCDNVAPPHIYALAFDDATKQRAALEVPETAVSVYRNTAEWSGFRNITAHHELSCSPSAVSLLNKAVKRSLTIDADGGWEVVSKPSWCSLSSMSGTRKTSISLSVSALSHGSGTRSGKIVFRLRNSSYSCECTVTQYDYEYDENQWITLHRATQGAHGGINVVLLGEGFDAAAVAGGEWLSAVRDIAGKLFSVEPYKTYKPYFNVYASVTLSGRPGIDQKADTRHTRFSTVYEGGSGFSSDYDALMSFVTTAPSVDKTGLPQTLVIVVPNTTERDGNARLWTNGRAVAYCPRSVYGDDVATLTSVLRYAGGFAFAKLGDETVRYNGFITGTEARNIRNMQAAGWYDNLSLLPSPQGSAWKRLMADSRYNAIVDVYDGGYGYLQGVFRSEPTSCLGSNTPYYNAVSRESIVRRIMRYAGQSYSFDDFLSHDKASSQQTGR